MPRTYRRITAKGRGTPRWPETTREIRGSSRSPPPLARRRGLNLRQREVADLAGCSERFVYTLERAKGSLRLDKVLDVLGVLGLGLEVGVGTTGVVARAIAVDTLGGHDAEPDPSR